MSVPAKRSRSGPSPSVRAGLEAAALELADRVEAMNFASPVSHVYNPLKYAWKPHQSYLRRANDARVPVLFLGMNPGPWGMAQTGVPFGEIAAVTEWLGISEPVQRPAAEHPKRPIEGFACKRSEVSGRRLWGLFRRRYKDAPAFFRKNLVLNYCPLVFMDDSGRNRTPDKLSRLERAALESVCDRHLAEAIAVTRPDFAVGIGVYAENALQKAAAMAQHSCRVIRILHPSPASPAANRDWEATVTGQLSDAGVWS